MLLFFSHQGKNNPNSVFHKALFNIQGVRVLPMRALVYTSVALAVVFLGLMIADLSLGLAPSLARDYHLSRMMMETRTQAYDFPLVAIRGRDEIPPKERPRILVIGDSFTWGVGVPNLNQTFHHIMRDELHRQGFDVDVFVLGFGSTQTDHHLGWLRDSTALQTISPDLIVIAYYMDDVSLDTMPQYHLPMHMPVSIQRVSSRFPIAAFRNIFPSFYIALDSMLALRFSHNENRFNHAESGYTAFAWINMLTQSPHIDRWEQHAVQPLAQLTQQANIPTIVFPIICSVYMDLMDVNLSRTIPVWERAGIPVYSPLDAFVDYVRANPRLRNLLQASITDYHHGPAASWFQGRFLADILIESYAHILGERGTRNRDSLAIEFSDWLPFSLSPQVLQQSVDVAQYTIEFPASDASNGFLTWFMRRPHVLLNFRHPVRLSSIMVEGENLRNVQVYTLGLNLDLGFDDQRPQRLRERNGVLAGCERYVTSLLIRASTVNNAGAQLTLTIENQGEREMFF